VEAQRRTMATHVFSLGLIPVQEWIHQARRSRDLRAGSVMLCHWMAKILARLPAAATEVVIPRAPAAEPGLFRRLAAAPFADALDEMTYGIPNRASGYFDTAVAPGPEADEEVRRTFGVLEAESSRPAGSASSRTTSPTVAASASATTRASGAPSTVRPRAGARCRPPTTARCPWSGPRCPHPCRANAWPRTSPPSTSSTPRSSAGAHAAPGRAERRSASAPSAPGARRSARPSTATTPGARRPDPSGGIATRGRRRCPLGR
jgi:CRISPR-associated protein